MNTSKLTIFTQSAKKLKEKNIYIGYLVFRKNDVINSTNLYLVDFDFKKNYHNKTHKILSKILLKKFTFLKYGLFYVWISKKIIFFYSFKKILPLKSRVVNFIIFNNTVDWKFMKMRSKTVNFVMGDGDNY